MPFWKKKRKKKVKPKTASAPTSLQKQTEEKRTDSPHHESKPKPPPYKPKTVNPNQSKPKTDIKHLNPKKEFLAIFKQFTYRHRAWNVWRDFITMFACSLSNPLDKTHHDEREERYMKTYKKYSKQEQELFPELCAQTIMALEENPEQDFLGNIFMELNLWNEHNGQFFTPYHVCELMAKLSMNDLVEQVKTQGYITIGDPCCGAGATLISGIHEARRQLEKAGLNFQNHILIAAQDIDETVALMCYIQLSLLGVAAYIKIGNTFTEPMSSDDSTENYWFTPMYFSNVWITRRLIHRMNLLFDKKESTEDGQK